MAATSLSTLSCKCKCQCEGVRKGAGEGVREEVREGAGEGVREGATTLETLGCNCTCKCKGVREAETEPPCTRSLSGAQLLALEEAPLQLRVPACSVAVERGVKDVTEAAMLATDSKERDGIVFNKLSSRKKVPYDKRNKVWGL